MDAKNDILGAGKQISLTPEQKEKLSKPLQAPVAPFQMSTNNPPEGNTEQNKVEQLPPKRLSYTEMFQKLNPNPTPTPEEVEKEKKRDRSRRIIAAVGDGISALSNLYFTTKGAPNMYNSHNSLSAAYKKRYDEVMAKRDANREKWKAGYMNAVQMDDNLSWRDKMHQYQIDRNKVTDDRAEAADKYKRENDKRDYSHKITREAIEDDYREKQLKEKTRQYNSSNALGWANYGLHKKAQEDSTRLQEKRIDAMEGKQSRGKRIGFSDGAGKEVGIYESVWKGSMQQVFDIVSKDIKPDKTSDTVWNRRMAKMKPQEKEDFVKQNWTKSQRAVAVMQSLSQIDPASMSSSDTDDFSQYKDVSTSDDDFSQYKQ